MPTTYISLQNLYKHAKEKGIDIDNFTSELLRYIRNESIRMKSGEFIKSRLMIFSEEKSIDLAIGKLPISASAHKRFQWQAITSNSLAVNFWSNGNYYLLVKGDEFLIYSDSSDRHMFKGEEVEASYLSNAWIDEERWVILCDDVENYSRREFHKVSLLRSDLHILLQSSSFEEPKRRGRKTKFDIQTIVDFAKNLLVKNPYLSKKRYDRLVKDKLLEINLAPQNEAYQKYYGRLHDEHVARRAAIDN